MTGSKLSVLAVHVISLHSIVVSKALTSCVVSHVQQRNKCTHIFSSHLIVPVRLPLLFCCFVDQSVGCASHRSIDKLFHPNFKS